MQNQQMEVSDQFYPKTDFTREDLASIPHWAGRLAGPKAVPVVVAKRKSSPPAKNWTPIVKATTSHITVSQKGINKHTRLQ